MRPAAVQALLVAAALGVARATPVAPAAGAGGEPGASPPDVAGAVAHDDECAADDETCAINALQLRAGVTAGSLPEAVFASSKINASSNLMEVMSDEESAGCNMVGYSGPAAGAESCFCHKSGNYVCAGKPCSCREGCNMYIMKLSQAATFSNTARTSCVGAKLTITKSYYTDIDDLKRKCSGGAHGLLTTMLVQGFNAYQGVQPGPVWQCIHKPGTVSVHWLHLHTFCQNGRVEDLPSRGSAYCAKMNSVGEASQAATQILNR